MKGTEHQLKRSIDMMKRSIGLVLTLILLWGSSVSAENNYNWIEGGKRYLWEVWQLWT